MKRAHPSMSVVGLVGPVDVVGGRTHEEVEEAQPVGPDRLVVLLGGDEVALGLGHLRSGETDHPLGEEAPERLARQARREPDVDEGLQVEARVEQVQDGVLDAADVLVDGHPLGDLDRVEGPVRREGVGEAQEVPRRVA